LASHPWYLKSSYTFVDSRMESRGRRCALMLETCCGT
jgi:hypothetical protein